MDIISDLPTNVIEIILARMPIRDAVRTSILSRKWRYLWVSIPQLVFDDTLCQEKPFDKKDLMFNIYQILLLHRGPILEFTLSVFKLESCSEIDQLILFLSRNGLEKLSLHIWSGNLYHKLASSFFSCLHLKHLNLCGCEFKPPVKFKGFSRLISLEFDEVVFDHKVFGSFISNCPLVEKLTLIDSVGFGALQFVAPKLKFLCLRGNVGSVCFKDVPLLSTLSISSLERSKEGEADIQGEMSNFVELFSYLSVIENLHMGYNFLKSLTAGGIPTKLLNSLIHLTILKLSNICLVEPDEISCVLCLVRSAPKLQKITIEMYDNTDADLHLALELLKVQGYSDVILEQLREVKMQFVSGTEPELEFIKLLLAKSPMLETMLIEPKCESVDRRLKMLTKLTRFPRVSPKAEIICEYPLPS